MKLSTPLSLLTRSSWLPLLLVRLYLGFLFMELGWGKVHNLSGMAERFTEWGIPWPAFNAALSSYTELFAGGLLMVGLLTRPAALLLAFNMAVATVTVKLASVGNLSEFVELDEPLYALVFLLLAFFGGGAVSLDRWAWSWASSRWPALKSCR